MDNVKIADDYKDRLFRMIFNDKEKLLERKRQTTRLAGSAHL